MNRGDVALRSIPYPYRAMLAIANDIDEASWDDFVLLHDFMNSVGNTPLGAGLGLEIGDSFFFYATARERKTPTFSYFEGCDPDRRAAWAGAIDSLIDAGYLDCLHSWGDFSGTGGFRRDLAVSALEHLKKTKRTVSVWINHGDACNEQMAGRPGWDDPSSPHGHADLAIGAGLRYYWTGSVTSVVGQNATDTWRDRVEPGRVVDEFIRPARKVLACAPVIVSFFRNRLMAPASVRGRTIQIFQRYGFWDKPAATDLGDVLSNAMLDRLERRGGFAAIYTHLFRRPPGMAIDGVDWSPLVELSRRHARGTIKVTTTSRLLAYAETRDALTWTTHNRRGALEIQLAPDAASSQLQGITFYVPDPDRTNVSVGGRELPIDRHAPDDTGRSCVSIPWQPLSYPVIATC